LLTRDFRAEEANSLILFIKRFHQKFCSIPADQLAASSFDWFGQPSPCPIHSAIFAEWVGNHEPQPALCIGAFPASSRPQQAAKMPPAEAETTPNSLSWKILQVNSFVMNILQRNPVCNLIEMRILRPKYGWG
jgi:hypothetical protein